MPCVGKQLEPNAHRRLEAPQSAQSFGDYLSVALRNERAAVTESIIENLESGRKVNLDISQLLNIAMALQVPRTYLLTPIGNPDAPIDLQNLSDSFDGMTAIQFDAWLSGLHSGTYRPSTMDECNARNELDVLREMTALTAEISRLRIAIELESEAVPNRDSDPSVQNFQERLDLAESQRFRLRVYLDSTEWALPQVSAADRQDRSASA